MGIACNLLARVSGMGGQGQSRVCVGFCTSAKDNDIKHFTQLIQAPGAHLISPAEKTSDGRRRITQKSVI